MAKRNPDSTEPLRVVHATDANDMAERAAALLAASADEAIRLRGRAVLALSGGTTPGPAFRALAARPIDWGRVHIFQVDERLAPAQSPDRNLTTLTEVFGPTGATIHAMPVELGEERMAASYAARLLETAGDPPRLDAVQLGLGADGHTASLFPGDPALSSREPVVLSETHAGWRRLSITLPVINNARSILWIASGGGKRGMIARLVDGDRSIPAGLVRRSDAVLVTDVPADQPGRGVTGRPG